MSIKEVYQVVKENYEKLLHTYNHISGSENPYKLGRLNALRHAILELSKIPFLKEITNDLITSRLFKTFNDEEQFGYSDYSYISNGINSLVQGLPLLISQYENLYPNEVENGLLIKFPEIHGFDDLSKLSNDFKKSIEIPILDSKVESNISIVACEPGSIWLTVLVGSFAAVNLVGAICWAAAVIRRKNAEAKMAEEHVKTLKLKNMEIEVIIVQRHWKD